MKETVAILVSLAALAPLPARAQSVGQVFERVKDAVVVIYTTQTEYTVSGTGQPVSVGGLGSGAVIGPSQILTAAHVVQAADQVWVELTTGDTIPAQVTTSDQAADVAMLELSQPAPTGAVELGDSDLTEVGDPVFVVGAPLGQTHTLTVGHVSARRTNAMYGGFDPVELFQTDAAINQGNSGGPMFNMDGQLIGVVSHILSTTGGFQGLGYAVTSKQVQATLENPTTLYWGWELLPLQGGLARLFNLPPPHTGALVQRVAAGSAAEAIGIRPGVAEIELGGQSFLVGGDVILGAMGIPLGQQWENLPRISEVLRGVMPGQAVTLEVLRGGERITLRGAPPPRP